MGGVPRGRPHPPGWSPGGGRAAGGLRNTGGSRTLSVSPPLPRTRSRLCTGTRISAACCGWAGSTGYRSPHDIPLRAPWRPWHTRHNLSGGGSPLGLPPPGMESLQRAEEVRAGHWGWRWLSGVGCSETLVGRSPCVLTHSLVHPSPCPPSHNPSHSSTNTKCLSVPTSIIGLKLSPEDSRVTRAGSVPSFKELKDQTRCGRLGD